mmetsp:Transcript_91965/g.281399  ORF Transcript_91965/g.281399 Transcript_91965/m.281399 type:complete len:204 (+) Transcript_91965:240-851(+)
MLRIQRCWRYESLTQRHLLSPSWGKKGLRQSRWKSVVRRCNSHTRPVQVAHSTDPLPGDRRAGVGGQRRRKVSRKTSPVFAPALIELDTIFDLSQPQLFRKMTRELLLNLTASPPSTGVSSRRSWTTKLSPKGTSWLMQENSMVTAPSRMAIRQFAVTLVNLGHSGAGGTGVTKFSSRRCTCCAPSLSSSKLALAKSVAPSAS